MNLINQVEFDEGYARFMSEPLSGSQLITRLSPNDFEPGYYFKNGVFVSGSESKHPILKRILSDLIPRGFFNILLP